MMKTFQKFVIGLTVIVGGFALWTLTLDDKGSKYSFEASSNSPAVTKADQPKPTSEPWTLATGNLWSGVTLYYGPKKMKVGEVLGGSDGEIQVGSRKMKAVLVKMDGGRSEWKSRDAIVTGAWYVRTDDPALKAMNWRIYPAN